MSPPHLGVESGDNSEIIINIFKTKSANLQTTKHRFDCLIDSIVGNVSAKCVM